MLILNQKLQITLLTTLILLSGSIVNCVDKIVAQTAIVPFDQSKPETVAGQLQVTIGKLRYYCASTAETLDLSAAARSAEIENLATRIDLLISISECNLQRQSQEFYWGFSFPTQELLELGKLDLLEKYLIKANPSTREMLEILGSNFTFIGITKADFLKLIETLARQITTRELTVAELIATKNPDESGCATARLAHIHSQHKEIEKLCRLWKHLTEFNRLPIITTAYVYEDFSALDQTFLEQAITSNQLSVVKYALSHDSTTDRIYALQIAVANYCPIEIIDFIINHSSTDPKVRAQLAAMAKLWDKEYEASYSDTDGDTDSYKCDSTTGCSVGGGSVDLKSPSAKSRSSSFSSDDASPVPVEYTSVGDPALDREELTSASVPTVPAVAKVAPQPAIILSPATVTAKLKTVTPDIIAKKSSVAPDATTYTTFGSDIGQTYFYC